MIYVADLITMALYNIVNRHNKDVPTVGVAVVVSDTILRNVTYCLLNKEMHASQY